MGVFLSSGAINVQLEAGKHYYIGVVVQGAFTAYYNSPASVPFVSFGQLRDSYRLSANSPPAQVYVGSSAFRYNQRLSTALPQ